MCNSLNPNSSKNTDLSQNQMIEPNLDQQKGKGKPNCYSLSQNVSS